MFHRIFYYYKEVIIKFIHIEQNGLLIHRTKCAMMENINGKRWEIMTGGITKSEKEQEKVAGNFDSGSDASYIGKYAICKDGE